MPEWPNPVKEDQQLWKYFKVDRFLEVVRDERFYFAAASQFDDPFEGAVAVISPHTPVQPKSEDELLTENAFRELKRLTKITCWHIEDRESDAMWRLYSGAGKGIAVTSTINRVISALKPFRLRSDYEEEPLLAKPVEYVDLMEGRLDVSMSDRFFFKHDAFSWEKEFRFLISLRLAEEFGVNVPEQGVFVDFDLSALINEVYLGPNVSSEMESAIVEELGNKGLADKVRTTGLNGNPCYV